MEDRRRPGKSLPRWLLPAIFGLLAILSLYAGLVRDDHLELLRGSGFLLLLPYIILFPSTSGRAPSIAGRSASWRLPALTLFWAGAAAIAAALAIPLI